MLRRAADEEGSFPAPLLGKTFSKRYGGGSF